MTQLMMMSLLFAAPPPRQDGAQILNELRRVSVLGTVLYVAAHPDDENTKLLASFANEAKFRTAYLSFTRGEGGQNLIGSELGPLLGVIRTQELLAARRLDGAEQYFTRARDFGYSKSVTETLEIWDHDRVLADAVWLIRTLRPDLIVTRFSPEPTGTHGHHTASARLALEAFKAAADPAFHPEQLQGGVTPWQAKRLFWNAWSPDPKVKLPEGMLQWDSSQFSPLLGLSYGELAAESRSQHKSQGFGAAPVHDGSMENFSLLAGEPATKTIFDGLDTSWKRVPGAEKFSAALGKATAEFKVDAPASSVPALLVALQELRALPENPWKAQKEAELVEVITQCA
ncbi:MAG TPA: PIG-L family deacetylase, partial [Archangium sp.]